MQSHFDDHLRRFVAVQLYLKLFVEGCNWQLPKLCRSNWFIVSAVLNGWRLRLVTLVMCSSVTHFWLIYQRTTIQAQLFTFRWEHPMFLPVKNSLLSWWENDWKMVKLRSTVMSLLYNVFLIIDNPVIVMWYIFENLLIFIY